MEGMEIEGLIPAGPGWLVEYTFEGRKVLAPIGAWADDDFGNLEPFAVLGGRLVRVRESNGVENVVLKYLPTR